MEGGEPSKRFTNELGNHLKKKSKKKTRVNKTVPTAGKVERWKGKKK